MNLCANNFFVTRDVAKQCNTVAWAIVCIDFIYTIFTNTSLHNTLFNISKAAINYMSQSCCCGHIPAHLEVHNATNIIFVVDMFWLENIQTC